jgi:hypothetical protein
MSFQGRGRPSYSTGIDPCNFWFFEMGMLKEVLKGREFSSSNKIEEVIAKILDELTFDEVQSVFHNWMSRLARVLENGGDYIIE